MTPHTSYSLQWRLVLSFVVVVVVTLVVSGVIVNNIVIGYLIKQEEGRFDQKVQVVVGELRYFSSIPELRSQLPQLERLIGVKLTLITDFAELKRLSPEHPDLGEPPPEKSWIPEIKLFPEINTAELRQLIPLASMGHFQGFLVVEPLAPVNPMQGDLTRALLQIGLLGVLLSTLLGIWLSRSLTEPIKRLALVAEQMAAGNLRQEIPEDRNDEIGLLARQFNEMSRQLQRSFNVITTERDRLKDFIADMSHELRTPLTAINTFNELLIEGADDDPEVRRRFLFNARKQIQRLNRLSENLLALSRLDSDLVKMEREPGDLRAAIREALNRVTPEAERKGIELRERLPAEPVISSFDAFQLGQALDNLLGNAVKYTPEKGRVEIELEADEDTAYITVRDTGPGIDPGEVEKIFRRFYRGKDQGPNDSGSGLGLAIVRAIIEAHGGRVEVTDPTRAEFTVELPLAQAD